MGILTLAIINLVFCGVPFMMVYFGDPEMIVNPTQAILLTCGIGLVSWFFMAMYSIRIIDKLRQSKSDKEALDFWQEHPEYFVYPPNSEEKLWYVCHDKSPFRCSTETLRGVLNLLQRMHFETTRWEKKDESCQ